MNAEEIETAVRHLFDKLLWFRQLRVGTGWGDDGQRTMDLWGIHDGKPWEKIAVEIKVSRSDYLRDVAEPLKQRRARLVCNEFYYAAPDHQATELIPEARLPVITPSDLPVWAGLILVSRKRGARIVVVAPWFDSSAPTWRFLAQLIRTTARRGGAK